MILSAIAVGLLLSFPAVGSWPCLDTIAPRQPVHSLPEVIIRKNRAQAKQQGDTLTYDAAMYRQPGTFKLLDLLPQVPGFRVDASGKIFFNGKEISRILIDGDDLTEERYTLLSRNFRASLLQNFQLIRRYQSKRLLQQLSTSEDIALNLTLKEEIKNKLTGSLKIEKGMRKDAQTDAELMRMTAASKQLVFANNNNTGHAGVVGKAESVSLSASNTQYHSGPLFPLSVYTHPALSSSYLNRNGDVSALGLLTFSAGRFNKIRLNLEKERIKESGSASRQREIHFMDAGLLSINTSSHHILTRENRGLSIRMQRDKGSNTTSGYFFRVHAASIGSSYFERRDARSVLDCIVKGQYGLSSLQWEQEWTKKLRNNAVVQIEHGLSTQRQSRTAQQEKTETLASDLITGSGILNHRGTRFYSQLTVHQMYRNWKTRYGIRTTLEYIRSSAAANLIHVQLYKNYFFVHGSKPFAKKWNRELQFAGGMAYWQKPGLNNLQTPIFHFDHAIAFRPRPLERYAFGLTLQKKAMDLSAIYAGPFLDERGMLLHGLDSIFFPTTISVHVDLMRMDLYKGLTASVNGKFSLVKHQPAEAYFVNSARDGKSYFLANGEQLFFVSGQLEKFFFPLHVKYRAIASYRFHRSPQQLNGVERHVFFSTFDLEQRIRSAWKLFFNIEFTHGITGHQVYLSPSNPLFNGAVYKKQIGIKFLFASSSSPVFGELHLSTLRYNHLQPFLMGDAAFGWRISSRWHVSFSLSNVFDQTVFREATAAFYGNLIQTTLLVRRRGLIGLQWSF